MGFDLFKSQQRVLCDPHVNPFQPIESEDIAGAARIFVNIEIDEGDDIDVDIDI